MLTRFDRQLRHVFINNAITRITGRAPAELIGKTNRELDLPPPLVEHWDEALQSVFSTRQPRSLRFASDSVAGRQHFSSRLVPEFGADGSVEHVLGVTHDVTSLRQLEQALREVDRRKDEFIAMLGHELRGPLAPLRNGVFLLQQAPADGSTTKGIHTMMERPLIAAAEHQLELQVAEQPVWLDGELTRLAQVLTNLLTNATKNTPRGGRIVLFAGVEGRNAVMRISDSGRGIAPSMQQHIFDMFAQIDGQREQAQAGLGIGLALVRQLLQLHGGAVECESANVGHGSTFIAWLPLPLHPSAREAGE